jgi:hypothetical protein
MIYANFTVLLNLILKHLVNYKGFYYTVIEFS